jgi:hypothetical protein
MRYRQRLFDSHRAPHDLGMTLKQSDELEPNHDNAFARRRDTDGA